MKRAYTKPSLAVESFQLDAAVAGACKNTDNPYGVAINHGATNCIDMQSGFFGANCELAGGINVTDKMADDGYCYHGPNDSLTEMFISS